MSTPTATARSAALSLLLAVAVVCLALVLGGCRSAPAGDGASAAPSDGRSASAAPSQGRSASSQNTTGIVPAGLAPARPTTRLPTVTVSELPVEAVKTLTLIANGGPYPYSKDGATFGNREGELPSQRSGFYREFTVVTPGSADRGARRIVAGSDGSRYYTADHYESFDEVIQP